MGVLTDCSSKSDICFISARTYEYIRSGYGTAGGAQRQQYLIGKKLANQGKTVSFIVGNYGQPSYEQIDGLHVWKGCPHEIKSPSKIPRQIMNLLSAMRKADAEFYYVRGAPLLCASAYVFSKLLQKKFIFCLANDSDINKNRINKLPRVMKETYIRAIANADAVITQTNKQQEAVKKLVGRNAEVIPNGYEPVPTNQISDHNQRNTVLWVGTDDYDQKRPKRFIQLAKSLPSIHFTMICRQIMDLEYHNTLEKKASNISNLDFIESVDPDKIHDFYNRSYALVNTSDYEGFPNTFLEAWRYRTPVISLKFGLDGILADKSVGRLSKTVNNLVHDVDELVSQQQERERLGRNGEQMVKSKFSLERVTQDYKKILNT